MSNLKNSSVSDQALDAISKKQPVNDLLDVTGLNERPSSSDVSFITAMSDLDIGSSPSFGGVAEDVATKLDAIAAESKSGEIGVIVQYSCHIVRISHIYIAGFDFSFCVYSEAGLGRLTCIVLDKLIEKISKILFTSGISSFARYLSILPTISLSYEADTFMFFSLAAQNNMGRIY